MESLSSFFAMGGYAGYVWPSYGLAVVLMVAVLVASARGVKNAERELEQMQSLRPGRRRRAQQAASVTEVPET
ncbi:MAG: heme exporter protein CcmD [Alphaproteobacteria bacterium]|nr:heme exporter protein CcmD [Alphaproteobacteria bacterium]